MPNIKSAKKALRQSHTKKDHNLFWKRRIRAKIKDIRTILETEPKNADILNKELSLLQKVVDKAAKNNVIKKNKANRIKSKFANKASAHAKDSTTKSKNREKSKSSKS